MTFGMTWAEHLTMVAFANMFCFATGYENELNMKVAASNVNMKYISCFLNNGFWCPRNHCTVENLTGLNTNWLLNNVKTVLVIMIIKLILICLSNSFFNFFIKIENEKRTFCLPFFLWKCKTKKDIKNSKKESIKRENGSQLFEFRLLYWSKSKIKV